MERNRRTGMTRVTLRDVAEEAGVATSTASRALARARRELPPTSDTAIRILAIADRMGYTRDLSAASLRTRRTLLLGVLVPRLTDVVLSTIYEGLEAEAAKHGYQTVVANTHDDPAEQRRRAELLLERRVDGLVFGDARLGETFLSSLAARGVPFVLVNRRQEPFDYVTCDDTEGGRLVATHLADFGHTTIGIVAGRPDASTGIDRTKGCVEGLRDRGIQVPSTRIVHSSFDAAGGRRAATTLLRCAPRPTAIFAVNDVTAIGVMGAIRDFGLTIGQDVAVVGFNDISLTADLPVPLTSVRSPMSEMGARAARLLIERLDVTEHAFPPGATARPSELRLTPRLIVRASSAHISPPNAVHVGGSNGNEARQRRTHRQVAGHSE